MIVRCIPINHHTLFTTRARFFWVATESSLLKKHHIFTTFLSQFGFVQSPGDSLLSRCERRWDLVPFLSLCSEPCPICISFPPSSTCLVLSPATRFCNLSSSLLFFQVQYALCLHLQLSCPTFPLHLYDLPYEHSFRLSGLYLWVSTDLSVSCEDSLCR